MAYTAGSLIEATDYNGFVSSNTYNVNKIFSTGSSDYGYGQSALSTVSAGGTVTATQWAGLVNNISSMASHTGTTITSRTAPTATDLIEILSNINTDLTNIDGNRGNAHASGSTISTFSGTTSKTSATGSGTASWTITFTHTITFSSANAARYFFNAGGIVKIQYGKTSTGTDVDAEWNALAGETGIIYFVGRVDGASQNIGGTTYTGTTRTGGTGGTETTLATTTGYYNLSTSDTTLFQLNDDTSPYSGEYIRTAAKTAGSGTQLVFTTTWVSDGSSGAGTSANISGGTATNSPATSITGTAPTTLVNLIAPSTTYLTASWGTPTIAASVS